MYMFEEIFGNDVQKTFYLFGTLIAVVGWAIFTYSIYKDVTARPAIFRSRGRETYVDRASEPVAFWLGLLPRALIILASGYFVVLLLANKLPQIFGR